MKWLTCRSVTRLLFCSLSFLPMAIPIIIHVLYMYTKRSWIPIDPTCTISYKNRLHVCLFWTNVFSVTKLWCIQLYYVMPQWQVPMFGIVGIVLCCQQMSWTLTSMLGSPVNFIYKFGQNNSLSLIMYVQNVPWKRIGLDLTNIHDQWKWCIIFTF